MTIDPERAATLRAKHGMNTPPDPDNPIVAAMLNDGPRLVGKMFNWQAGTDGPGLHQLFDPTQCPEMHAIATRAQRGLRIAMAAGEVECLDGHGSECDIDDTAMLVNFVGSQVVCVVQSDEVDDFAAEYRATSGANVRKHPHAICQVRLAPNCGGVGEHQRTMEFWPWLCGRYLLVFVVCPACRDRAIAIADDGRKLGDIAAHEQLAELPLPQWARTDPGTDSGGGAGR